MKKAIAALIVIAACGGSPPPTTVPSIQEMQEEVDQINACTAEWDIYVNEWNALTTDERDHYGTYEEWAITKGYPLTYEEHCP